MIGDSNTAAVLRSLHDSEQRLVQVTGYFWRGDAGAPEMLLNLELEFDGALVCFRASEDDSLLVETLVPELDPSVAAVVLGQCDPWKDALQKPLLWSWLMTNQQGYDDGVQLEFAHTGADVPVIVQLVALGAEVRVRRVAVDWIQWRDVPVDGS